MKKILVATDFSAGSRRALGLAAEIADKFGAKLLLLHVLHDPAEAPGFYAAKKAGKKVFRNLEQAAETMMADFVADLKKFKKYDTLILPGLPPVQIVACAQKQQADLIVMGTHGRSGLQRLMIGSVADKVIRTAPCPVLTVQEPQKAKGSKKSGKAPDPTAVPEDLTADQGVALDEVASANAKEGAE